jgi:hypothetical protein
MQHSIWCLDSLDISARRPRNQEVLSRPEESTSSSVVSPIDLMMDGNAKCEDTERQSSRSHVDVWKYFDRDTVPVTVSSTWRREIIRFSVLGDLLVALVAQDRVNRWCVSLETLLGIAFVLRSNAYVFL